MQLLDSKKVRILKCLARNLARSIKRHNLAEDISQQACLIFLRRGTENTNLKKLCIDALRELTGLKKGGSYRRDKTYIDQRSDHRWLKNLMIEGYKEKAYTIEVDPKLLNTSEKTVIDCLFFKDMTARQVSILMDVDESRISQIMTSALKKLRKAYKFKGITKFAQLD